MNATAGFDEIPAHRFFSANCFNRAWDLIDKAQRSPDEDEQMLLLAQAALWHWTQRDDCTARNLSIGCWQISRIHALLGNVEGARRYGESSLRHGQNEPPFYVGYAHEALARAAAIAGDQRQTAHHLAEAGRYAAQVPDANERSMLEGDLATIR